MPQDDGYCSYCYNGLAMYEGKMSKVNCSAETKINKIKYEIKKKKKKKKEKKYSKIQYNTNPHQNPI